MSMLVSLFCYQAICSLQEQIIRQAILCNEKKSKQQAIKTQTTRYLHIPFNAYITFLS